MSKKIYIIVTLLTMVVAQSFSQSITNYTFASSTGTFTALSSATNPTLTGGTDDGYSNAISIGFDFWYMGTRYTTVSVSTNGWITLGANTSDALYANALSTNATPRPIIAPLWDDLDMQLGSLSYKLSGSAPNRVFTVQHLNAKWDYMAGGSAISMQTNLYESTGKIEFIYRPEATAANAPTASVGITASATGSGNFLSVNNAGTSVSSTTEASVTTKPVSGKTYAFTPPVPTAPGSLTFSSVGNSAMTLNWTDLSSNETGFVIYKSTDGVTYSFVSQTAAGATSSLQSGLAQTATYYWKVYAVSEGGLSSALSGSQATTTFSVSNWLYRKMITVDYTKVASGPHTDFPVLVSMTDNDLKTKAKTNGDDILFVAADGVTQLSHEIESYTSATGALVAWVKIPSLSSSANTIFYMYYGNAAASSQQDVTGTWNANYKGVYHLNGAVSDATSNANNGSDNGSSVTTSATGKLSNGRAFNGSAKITIPGLMGSPASFTLSGWGNLTTRDNTGSHLVNIGDYTAINGDDVTDGYEGSYYNSSVLWALTKSSPKYNSAGTGWHYFVYTFTNGAQTLYKDGASAGSGTYAGNVNYSGLGSNTVIGSHANGGTNFDWIGTIDEVRVSNVVRSAGWTLTEYNNQNSPSTFYSVGSEDCRLTTSPVAPTNLILNYKFTGNATDAIGTNNGTLQNAPTLTTDRFGIAASAYTFNGSSQYVSTSNSYTNPGNFSMSIWFKTATTSGGLLMGFGSGQTGASVSYDRNLYMNNAGQLYFGINPGPIATINSASSYNDNNWHLATATLSTTTGMILYVDGVQVAINAGGTTPQNFSG